MTLTRRQIHFLIACAILIFILAFIPQDVITEIEVFLIILVGIPLGLYIATDPAKISK